MPMVELKDVRKKYGQFTVLDGVSFSAEKGSVTTIIGRSGSGKSTMLRCINGLETIESGSINVCGFHIGRDRVNLRSLRRKVGIVFQSYNLFPHYDVLNNVTLALRLVKKIGRKEAEEIARRVLDQVGLSDKVRSRPSELSGGQQQRVAIARSLAMAPEVMLFDEVTSALDPELTAEVLKVLVDLASTGMTMLVVTHEMKLAQKIADEVVFMNQGRIWERGPPSQVLKNPNTVELQKFIAD